MQGPSNHALDSDPLPRRGPRLRPAARLGRPLPQESRRRRTPQDPRGCPGPQGRRN